MNNTQENKTLDMSDFRDYIRPISLTIKDITSLKPGQTIKLLVLDRNFDEIACEEETNQLNIPHKAEEFFRLNTATYVHQQNLKGIITYDNIDLTRDFEFDIEYEKDCWYPLKNNCLPKKDPQHLASFSFNEPKPYTDYPANTRIGWRGPMILWEKVKKLPDIYWGVEYWLGNRKMKIINKVVEDTGMEWYGDMNDFKWEKLSGKNGQKIMKYLKENNTSNLCDWLEHQEKTVTNEKEWLHPLYIHELLDIILFLNTAPH